MEANDFADQWMKDLPLYKKVLMSAEDVQGIVHNIQSAQGSFDQYCPSCMQDSTFRFHVSPEFSQAQNRINAAVSISSTSRGANKPSPYRDFSKVALCTRAGHRQIYHYQAHDDGILKIGQYPSMADVSLGHLKRYQKALGADDLKALKMAIGLHAHGVGAGAFVYLRRIFEAQVETAHNQALAESGWDEDAFRNMRMGEKIQALKLHLPEVLVHNSSLYGILSEHIHNLTEAECLANFDVVHQGILVIADERLAQLERAQRLSAFNKSKSDLLSARTPKPASVELPSEK